MLFSMIFLFLQRIVYDRFLHALSGGGGGQDLHVSLRKNYTQYNLESSGMAT